MRRWKHFLIYSVDCQILFQSICTSEIARDFESFTNQSRFRSYTDSDTASTVSQDQDSPILHTDHQSVHSGSVDSGFHVGSHSQKSNSLVHTPDNQSSSSNSSYADTTSRMKRLENVVKLTPHDDNDGAGLEVIRMKGHKTKRKKNKTHQNHSVQVQSEVTLKWSGHAVHKNRSEMAKCENSGSDEASIDSIDKINSPLPLLSPDNGGDFDADAINHVPNKIEVIGEEISLVQNKTIGNTNQSSNKIVDGEVKQEIDSPNVLYSHFDGGVEQKTESPIISSSSLQCGEIVNKEEMHCTRGPTEDLDTCMSLETVDGIQLKDGKPDRHIDENEVVHVRSDILEDVEKDIKSDDEIVHGSSSENLCKSSSSLLNERVNFILSQPASNFQCIFVEDEDEDDDEENGNCDHIKDDGSIK